MLLKWFVWLGLVDNILKWVQLTLEGGSKFKHLFIFITLLAAAIRRIKGLVAYRFLLDFSNGLLTETSYWLL
jgi:hypothetical protein